MIVYRMADTCLQDALSEKKKKWKDNNDASQIIIGIAIDNNCLCPQEC